MWTCEDDLASQRPPYKRRTKYKPNHGREGICPPDGPIGRGERVYTQQTDQSDEGRGYMPTARTNQMRGEGILPTGRTNQMRGEGV
eukprot:146936-Pyramimonas_sp.AAC.1